jgi:hypothetical protein
MARYAAPLAAYYAVTLALPLATGGAADGFMTHAAGVLVIPPLVIAAWRVTRSLWCRMTAGPRS